MNLTRRILEKMNEVELVPTGDVDPGAQGVRLPDDVVHEIAAHWWTSTLDDPHLPITNDNPVMFHAGEKGGLSVSPSVVEGILNKYKMNAYWDKDLYSFRVWPIETEPAETFVSDVARAMEDVRTWVMGDGVNEVELQPSRDVTPAGGHAKVDDVKELLTSRGWTPDDGFEHNTGEDDGRGFDVFEHGEGWFPPGSQFEYLGLTYRPDGTVGYAWSALDPGTPYEVEPTFDALKAVILNYASMYEVELKPTKDVKPPDPFPGYDRIVMNRISDLLDTQVIEMQDSSKPPGVGNHVGFYVIPAVAEDMKGFATISELVQKLGFYWSFVASDNTFTLRPGPDQGLAQFWERVVRLVNAYYKWIGIDPKTGDEVPTKAAGEPKVEQGKWTVKYGDAGDAKNLWGTRGYFDTKDEAWDWAVQWKNKQVDRATAAGEFDYDEAIDEYWWEVDEK